MKKTLITTTIILLLTQSFININKEIIKKTISLNKTFKLSVATNPSTGYSWQWINENECNNVKIANKTYKTNCKDPKMVGCGGIETYFFKGILKGVDTVKMQYSRSFDPNSVVETKTIIIRVK